MKLKNKKLNRFIEVAGWFGAVAIIVAFSMVSFGFMEGRSYSFQVLNLFGALSLSAVSFSKKAYQPAVLNVIFSIVAVAAILSLVMG